jgi:hypothetical protein
MIPFLSQWVCGIPQFSALLFGRPSVPAKDCVMRVPQSKDGELSESAAMTGWDSVVRARLEDWLGMDGYNSIRIENKME